MEFVHLNVYSGYSYLKSALTVRRIARRALKSKEPFCALADALSFRGAGELDSYCLPRHIAPLHGIAFPFPEGRLIGYVESEEGYRALLRKLEEANEGTCSFRDFSSPLSGVSLILDCASPSFAETYFGKEEALASFLAPFASWGERFYLGLPSGQKKMVSFLRRFVSVYPFSLLAFPFVAYEKEEDAIALSMLQALESGDVLESDSHSGPYHYLSDEELLASFTSNEIQASVEIAKRCASFSFTALRGHLPSFPLPPGEKDAESYLRKRCYAGLSKRLPNHDERYPARLEHELSVIFAMGYADYFLIVADYVAYAKSAHILVGPGRGSGGGSLVSYCLGIVKLDPVEHELLFERFLNQGRQEMPDIDIDFEDVSRDAVIAYLEERYGRNRVSRIETSQTLGARQALLDCGRIFSFKASDIRLLTSRANPSLSLVENLKTNFEFAKLVSSDPYYRKIVSLAFKIEGLPRQAGLHAAGIVLDEHPLSEVAPVSYHEGVGSALQLDKDELQRQGFLKFDLLGLTNLSLISHCLRLISRFDGADYAYEELPYEDKDAISLIAEGKTMGLFQLESVGMNKAIDEIAPTHFEDVAACIALYRPGPMENIPTYARRKKGLEKVHYPCPELESVLKPTYGIFVYQEQIMMASRVLASFSPSEADAFRRAISRKDADALSRLKPAFLEGCAKNGFSSELSMSLYALIEKFADYGFNKSHAYCYAVLSCQMAFLKAHHPLCFYCALLDYGGGGEKKRPRLLRELKKAKIPFFLPSVNASGLSYLPEKGGIRLPLLGISLFPGALAEALLDERELHGPYESVFSFALRLVPKGLRLEHLIALIDAGAFDELHPSRAGLRASASSAISFGELFGGEANLLHSLTLQEPELHQEEDDRVENLLLEKEKLGMMVSGSLLESYAPAIKEKGARPLEELAESSSALWVAGILKSVKTIVTKKGTKMCFFELEDSWSVEEFTCFSSLYDRCYPLLKEGSPLFVLARRERYRKETCQALDILPIPGGHSHES